MEKNEVDGKPAKKLKTIAKKPDQIILNPVTVDDNNKLNERVVQLAQRRKRASLMRRVQSKLKRRKELSRSKLHSQTQLSQKSSRIAKSILRKRFAGGQGANYQHLSPSNKIQVDKIVDKKAILIRSMAKRMIPRLRSADVKRLQAVRSGGSVHGIQSYLSNRQLNMGDDFDLDHLVGMFEQITEKDIIALEAKASQNNIPEEVLEMVFIRGLYEGDKDKAFNRVNSFIALGEAKKIDTDLESDSKPSDRLEGSNSLAKVYKKETPGQSVKEEVWDEPNPKKKHSTMSPSQKASAKARAKAAGRPYPNLVDNMAAMKEAKDPREYDYEGDMAKSQLRSIIANAQAVHDMLKDDTNMAEWVQSKITLSADYISTVRDYMASEMSEEVATDKQVKMAVGIANDKRYAGGNMTGAVKVMDKIKKGLANHPKVQGALKKANEQVEPIDELKSSTLTSYIDKVATGPSRGKTQSGLLKSIKAITGVTKAIRKRSENNMREDKLNEISLGAIHNYMVAAHKKFASSSDEKKKAKLEKGIKQASKRREPKPRPTEVNKDDGSPGGYYAGKKPGEYTGD
jgi:hypothetical protein